MKDMGGLHIIEGVINRWRNEGVSMLPPVDEAGVIAALAKTGRRYSRDVVALYRATGGMAAGESDSHVWALWPLEKVVAENVEYERPHLLFADFLIHSHFYCFRYEDEGRSAVCVDYLDGQEPASLTGSVVEFFELYLKDPGKLEMFG